MEKYGYALFRGHIVTASADGRSIPLNAQVVAELGENNVPAVLEMLHRANTQPVLLAALERLVNDSMFKDHPEASQAALDAIALAKAGV